jgi:hypothetical protein
VSVHLQHVSITAFFIFIQKDPVTSPLVIDPFIYGEEGILSCKIYFDVFVKLFLSPETLNIQVRIF